MRRYDVRFQHHLYYDLSPSLIDCSELRSIAVEYVWTVLVRPECFRMSLGMGEAAQDSLTRL